MASKIQENTHGVEGLEIGLKKQVKQGVDNAIATSNTAVATNFGKKGAETSMSSRQRVVSRNGETTIVEELVERTGK